MAREELRIRCEERTGGSRVLLIQDGVVKLDLPWQMVDDVCQAMKAKARLAEAADKRGPIIADQALLTAHSVPLGLSNDPRVRKEANKEAEDIRRKAGLPSIEPRSVVGVPAVQQSAPESFHSR